MRLSQSSSFKAKTSSLREPSPTNPSTITEMKYLRELFKLLINVSVWPSQGSCFKVVLIKQQMTSSFRRGAKCEITERNPGKSAKWVSVEKQPPEVLYKKKLLLKILPAFRPAFLLKRGSSTRANKSDV